MLPLEDGFAVRHGKRSTALAVFGGQVEKLVTARDFLDVQSIRFLCGAIATAQMTWMSTDPFLEVNRLYPCFLTVLLPFNEVKTLFFK